MSSRATLRGDWFEPEVTLPANPYEAAAVLFGVAAYPARGAGRPGGHGAQFAWALTEMLHRQAAPYSPAAFRDHNFPRLREINGPLSAGLVRLRRRLVARQLEAELRERRLDSTSPPTSFRAFVLPQINQWLGPISLKIKGDVNPGTDEPEEIEESIRRIRYAHKESVPVIHIINALFEAGDLADISRKGVRYRPALLRLYYLSPHWIDDAIELIERFQASPGFWKFHPPPHFVRVVRPEKSTMA